jgi:tRNA pseudouridine38-40 synthase
MRNVRILVAYDGTRFFGWQRQAGFPSVQQALEEALEVLVGEHVAVHGSGRTDTGVHALGQTASFHVATRLSDERLLQALNAHLPEGVAVRALETCRDDFHAQFEVRAKRYLYLVRMGAVRPPFGQGFEHWTPLRLDLAAMRQAAHAFLGEQDFTSFASSGSARRSNVRRVSALHLRQRRDRLAFVVQGNGFLYKMVRAMVGTLIEVGRGKLDAAAVGEILRARDRRWAGPTAPAAGLYLLRVLYTEPCFQGVASSSYRAGISGRGLP